jgi:hypothetical protein
MKRLLGIGAAAMLALSAAAAHADEITGVITQINPTDNTFMVGDELFALSAQNTVGPTLKELEVGDKVTVFYERSTEGPVSNATTVTLVKD